MASVGGLHHMTAISGPAQESVDLCAGVLGMRLVKKSVNQDEPGRIESNLPKPVHPAPAGPPTR